MRSATALSGLALSIALGAVGCEPPYDTDDLPGDGMLAVPSAVEAPEGCVADGMSFEIDGRWQLWNWEATDGDSPMNYSYPLIATSAEAGVQFVVDGEEASPVQTYWDPDLLFFREEFPDFNYVRATYVCRTTEGWLAARQSACYHGSCWSTPGRMDRFGALDEPAAQGLELVGAWESTPFDGHATASLDLRVDRGMVYLSRDGDLQVIDVSDPTSPQARSSIVDGEWHNDVEILPGDGGPYLALSGDDRTYLVDASDPGAVEAVAELGFDEYSHTLFVEGTRLYLGTQTRDVPIFDVTRPEQPTLLARVSLPSGGVHDLWAEGDTLYVAHSEAGFLVVDIRDPSNPQVLGEAPHYFSHDVVFGTIAGRRLAFHGEEGRGAHLDIYDVDPASPDFMTVIGTYQTRRETSIHNMILVGTRLYIAYYHDGVRVLDVADPTRPTEIAHYQTWQPDRAPLPGNGDTYDGAIGIDVDPATGLIYVAEARRGLLILRETR